MEQKRTCPECNLIFEAAPCGDGLSTCPLCDTVFSTAPAAPMRPIPFPATPPVAEVPLPLTSARHVLKGCLAVGALIFLVGGLVYAYRLVGGVETKATGTQPPPPATAPISPETPVVVEVLPSRLEQPTPSPRAIVRAPEPRRLPPPILDESTRPLTERVNRAIDRGVAYLRTNHQKHNQYRNYLGLLGLTLLECGVPRDDPTVRQIAAWLRTRERDLHSTYELSLAILFLDRLDDSRDRSLIRTFGQRLVAGQLECGAWTYSCILNDKKRRPPAQSPGQMGPQILQWSNGAPLNNPLAQLKLIFRGDNSNTQFAILGLWVAQRHGVSARRALLATEQYFRQTQLSDGSWSYHPRLPNYRDSMTCAGLMSMAMRYGVINGQGRDIRPEQPVHVSDRAIRNGLQFLDRTIDKVQLADRRVVGADARDPLYFLWSLERMAVIYDLKTIGGKEWYPWEAEMLVEIQEAQGSWYAPYPSPVGTCFALLILKRSNMAHDLQLTVQGRTPPRRTGPIGPTVIQGPGAVLDPTTIRRGPIKDMPGIGERGRPTLGSTITQTPDTKPGEKKLVAPVGVPAMPNKK